MIDLTQFSPHPEQLDWINVDDRLPELYPCVPLAVSKLVLMYNDPPDAPTLQPFVDQRVHIGYLTESPSGARNWRRQDGGGLIWHGVTRWTEIPASWCDAPSIRAA